MLFHPGLQVMSVASIVTAIATEKDINVVRHPLSVLEASELSFTLFVTTHVK